MLDEDIEAQKIPLFTNGLNYQNNSRPLVIYQKIKNKILNIKKIKEIEFCDWVICIVLAASLITTIVIIAINETK
jgi:hypothetical protein